MLIISSEYSQNTDFNFSRILEDSTIFRNDPEMHRLIRKEDESVAGFNMNFVWFNFRFG